MSGDDDDETLVASKDWLAQQNFRAPPPAGGPAQSAPMPPLPQTIEAPEGAFGAPPFVMTFLLVCGVLTALGLVALIYLEM